MNQEDLYQAITELRDDQILAGEERLKARRPAKPKRHTGALVAVLAVAVLAGVLFLPKLSQKRTPSETDGSGGSSSSAQTETTAPIDTEQPTDETWSGSIKSSPELSKYSLASAAYPKMAPYPTERNRASYESAWKTWRGQRLALRPSEDYVRGVDGFLRTAIPALLDGAEGENRVVSPLNIYMALAMLAESTAGETRQELMSLLQATDIASLRKRANALWRACYSDDGRETCLLGASLWLRDDMRYQSDTVSTMAEDYYASVFSGPMGSEEYNEALRAWVNDQTGGLLAAQTPELGMNEETAAELLTTVLLKSPWAFEFLQSETGVFHGASGDSEQLFMTEQSAASCWFGKKFTAAGKSLCGGGQMYFLLPEEGVTPEELLKRKEVAEFLSDAVGRDKTENRYVILTLSVPKFDVSSQTELEGPLKALGVGRVFEPEQADFSPLFLSAEGGLSLTKIRHGARLSVDEKGVTGAAVTEAAAGAGEPPEEKVELTLDRPFLFAVTNSDGLPIFVGVVNDPG